MKHLLLLFFLALSINGFSQNQISTNVPAYFFDSVRVSAWGTFDANKIQDIQVVKNDPLFPNGKIYIKSKKSQIFKFLSAQDVLKIYNLPSGTLAIFMLDNEIIKDTTTFKIDSSYILNVEIVKASEIEYLPNNISSLAILKIFTATKGNIDKQKMIRVPSYVPATNN